MVSTNLDLIELARVADDDMSSHRLCHMVKELGRALEGLIHHDDLCRKIGALEAENAKLRKVFKAAQLVLRFKGNYLTENQFYDACHAMQNAIKEYEGEK